MTRGCHWARCEPVWQSATEQHAATSSTMWNLSDGPSLVPTDIICVLSDLLGGEGAGPLRQPLFQPDRPYYLLTMLRRSHPQRSFDRHALREIARFVHIRPPHQRHVIRQQLQRHHVQDR